MVYDNILHPVFCSFPLLFVFVVGGLGFELCVFVAGWRHALRSEWPFIIIIIITLVPIENESNMWPTEIPKCSEYQSGHAAFTVCGVRSPWCLLTNIT